MGGAEGKPYEQVCDDICMAYNHEHNIEEVEGPVSQGQRNKRKSNVIGIIKRVIQESYKKPIDKVLDEVGIPHPETGELVKMKITRNNPKRKRTENDSLEEDCRDLRAKKPRKFDAKIHVNYVLLDEKEVKTDNRLSRMASVYIEQGKSTDLEKWASLLGKIYNVSVINVVKLIACVANADSQSFLSLV
jgi:hypothetical protein